MEVPNDWLKRVGRWLFPVKMKEAVEPPERRVIIFSVHPAFGMDVGGILEGRGFEVRCPLDYAAVSVCFGDSWSDPDLVLVNAGARADDWTPLGVIEWVRDKHGYKGPIIGCAVVRKVQEEMKEAGATETCPPNRWAEAVFPRLKLPA